MAKSDEQGKDGKPTRAAKTVRRLRIGAYGTSLLSLAGAITGARMDPMMNGAERTDATAVLSPAEKQAGVVYTYLPDEHFDKSLQATGLMGLSMLGAGAASAGSHYASAIEAEEEEKKKKKTKGGDEPPEGGLSRS
jgi:hypothetical protein